MSNNLKIITSNIKFDSRRDGINEWKNRVNLLSGLFNEFSPDIIGTQEGREPQIRNLLSRLLNLEIVEGHRKWIKERMYPCLFYNPQKYTLIDSGDIWLSSTPEIPGSSDFGSAFPRLCTWALFHKAEGKNLKVLVANTHLDHLQASTRIEQARVLLDQVINIKPASIPLVLLGDFNEGPDEAVHQLFLKSDLNLHDPWLLLNKTEETSFHKFKADFDQGKRIDWILTSNSIQPNSIELDKRTEGEIFPSDHYPVKSEFIF